MIISQIIQIIRNDLLENSKIDLIEDDTVFSYTNLRGEFKIE